MGKTLNSNILLDNVEWLNPPAPILQISRSDLRVQTHQFLNGFPGETSYAVKANPHPEIVSELANAGITVFDVASLHEMELVRSVLPDAVLHYHNPVRSRQETAIAYHFYNCRRFSVDHESSLYQILEQAGSPDGVEIAIRFRMEAANEAVQSFQSKFGVCGDKAIMLANLAEELGFTIGLTFHPGSQTTSPDTYLMHMREAARIAGALPSGIEFLNIGGGFPSNYKRMETADLEDYFIAIKKIHKELFRGSNPKLECEPGRALVASSGKLVTFVKQVRRDTRELYLNDGIYGGLMEFHQFPRLQPNYSADSDDDNGTQFDWVTYGPTCDPADVLPAKLRLPASLKEGDRVTFSGTGAYSLATATRFNGYGAIDVVLI